MAKGGRTQPNTPGRSPWPLSAWPPIPTTVRELATGRQVCLAWKNEDALTFEVGEDPDRCFVKWAPAGSPPDLATEAARMTWALAYTPVPRVIGLSADGEGSWLVTAALPGQNAVSQPGRAVVRLISMRAVKVVAAAAAVCVAALSGCTAGQRSPVSVPANMSLPRPGGMPRFYLVVAGLEVVVRASAGGHVTGSVAIPGPTAMGRTSVGGEAFGSSDGRHFVIVVSRGGDLPGVADVTLFRLTVSPGGRPGGLRRLTFDSTGEPVTGAALSPDGAMLALSLVREFPAGPLYGSVEVLDVASGATRTWTGQSTPGYWPGIPAWASNSAIVVPWWHSTALGTVPAVITGIRHLDTAAPGGSSWVRSRPRRRR